MLPKEHKYNLSDEPTIYPTIIEVSTEIRKGSLNALVGPVGSGKTSFLLGLTGEMPKTTGHLRYTGTVAYVEQEPTIFAGTFKESILFGKPYDEAFYNEVIRVCNLETDLALFPKGNDAEIGERGNNLSGGQKARLALARGVYAKADIYLLDDPLSAVDPKVAKSIFDNCISGILKGKTVILVTHQVDFAKRCENVIFMRSGRIQKSSSFQKIEEDEGDVLNVVTSVPKALLPGVEDLHRLKKKSSIIYHLHRHHSDHQATINEPHRRLVLQDQSKQQPFTEQPHR